MDLLLPALCFFLGAFTQGLTGFGSAMIPVALLPLVWPVPQAVGVVTVFCVVLNAWFAWSLRADADRGEVGGMAVAGALATPLGLLFLRSYPSSTLLGALGAVLVVSSVLGLARPRLEPRALHRGWGLLAGGAAGALSGAFNTAGPPMLVYASLRGWGPAAFRANLQTFFLVTSCAACVGFVQAGIVNADTLRWNLLLAPAFAIGGLAGHWLHARLAARTFQRLVQGALLLVGLRYVAQGLGLGS